MDSLTPHSTPRRSRTPARAALFAAVAVASLSIPFGCDRTSGPEAATTGPDSAKPPIVKPAEAIALPTTVPSVATAPAPMQPSFLYLKYIPDPDDSSATNDTVPVATADDLGSAQCFPAARLRITGHDESLTALLFSDDPKEAIAKGWNGDRYYFRMPLQQGVDAKHIDGAEWLYTTSPTDKEETGNGVFLGGDRMHLEPISMRVGFEGSGPNIVVRISGQFLLFDTSDTTAKPKWVQV